MNTSEFTPTLFVKEGCPFSLKARLFLLESGLLDKFSVVQGSSPEEHQVLVGMLNERMGKASFPTVEVERDVLLSDSDAVIKHYAEQYGVDVANLPTYQAYAHSVFPAYLKLYRENAELKKLHG